MPFWDHLEELRRRFLRAFAAVGAAAFAVFSFGVGWVPAGPLSLPFPYPTFTDTLAASFFRLLSSLQLPAGVRLAAIHPADTFTVHIMDSLFLGLAAAMPVVLREIGAFVGPGLQESERRLLRRWVVPGTLLFAAGALLAFFLVLPLTFQLLHQLNEAYGVESFWRVTDFVSLVLLFLLAFGLIFQMPLLMVLLTSTGLVSARGWREGWRMAVIAIFVFAAVITPDASGVTQLMVALPMMGLYFAG
ncbi:MAG: twin-arginine translocase subunit TatC, partial [Halobacteria archaeon]